MKITYKYWNEATRQAIAREVEVTLVETYKNHSIVLDKEEWYYVFDGENWQYFDSKREARKFIRESIW